MKLLRPLVWLHLLLAAVSSEAEAQTVRLKDGKVFSAMEMRREGNFLFLKATHSNGAVTDELVQLPQLERIDFGEIPALVEAKQMANNGNAVAVLEKSSQLAAQFGIYADLPGNPWPDIMRLRLPALAVSGTSDLLSDLEKHWTPTNDTEIDTAYRLLIAAKNDPAGARIAWKTLAQPGAGSLAAGIAWIGIGEAALDAKEWRNAARAFLSVEVFLPQYRLLVPKALLGAAKAFKGKGDQAKASQIVHDIVTDFPGTPEATAAAEVLK
jgi:hypothetical protein